MTVAPRLPELDALIREFDRVTRDMSTFHRQAFAGLLAISMYDRDDVLAALGAQPVYALSEKPLL